MRELIIDCFAGGGGLRGHRPHPGADPGAEGAGYGESASKRHGIKNQVYR